MVKTFKLLLILCGAALLSNQAYAGDVFPADGAQAEGAPAMVAPSKTGFDWSGVYVGVQGGYGFLSNNVQNFGFRVTDAGVPAGGLNVQAMYQTNHFVFGGVVDQNLTSGQFSSGPCGNPLLSCISTSANNLSARGKAGYAMNNFLVYGTGGWGWADYQKQAYNGGALLNSTQLKLNGWVAGAGLGVALSPHVVAGVEYLHYDLGSASPRFIAGGEIVAPNYDSVMVSLDYKF